MIISIIHVVYIMTSTIIYQHTHSHSDESLRQRLYTEAISRWATYREIGRRFQASHTTIDYDLQDNGDRTVRIREYYEYKQNARCAMELRQLLPPLPGKLRPEGKLSVINPKYRFELKRENSEAKWLLVHIDLNPIDKIETGLSPDLVVQAALVDRPLTFSSIHERLPDLLQDPDFKVVTLAPIAESGRMWIRVAFSCRPKKTVQRIVGRSTIRGAWLPLVGGWFDLDPQSFWLLQRYEVRTKWEDSSTGVMSASFEYSHEEVPLLKRIVTRYNQISGSSPFIKSETIQEYQITMGEPSDAEFTLSAFGLPEPVGVVWEKKTPVYVWLLLAAGVLGLLALVLRWLAHRRRTTG